jgi:hypothetical protein
VKELPFSGFDLVTFLIEGTPQPLSLVPWQMPIRSSDPLILTRNWSSISS